jgi:predicted transcriptional regulator
MRTTITLNDDIYRAVKLHAADSGQTISELVQDAIKAQLLEDFEDIQDAQKREGEKTYSFEEVIKELKKDGLL